MLPCRPYGYLFVSSKQLTDFGLSKVGLIDSTNDISGPISSAKSLLVEEKPKLPTSEHKQSAMGTPDYLAPEILLGTGHGAYTFLSHLVVCLSLLFQILLLSRNWCWVEIKMIRPLRFILNCCSAACLTVVSDMQFCLSHTKTVKINIIP